MTIVNDTVFDARYWTLYDLRSPIHDFVMY